MTGFHRERPPVTETRVDSQGRPVCVDCYRAEPVLFVLSFDGTEGNRCRKCFQHRYPLAASPLPLVAP